MKVKQEFFGFNPVMWMGVVEDNNDPIKLGRLRVRIFGWHSGSLKDVDGEPGVQTEELPWAQVMQPVSSGSNSGIGGPLTGIQQGTWVMGIFLDGEIAREPLVMGSIPGIPTQANPNPPDGEPVEGFYDPGGIYPLKDKMEEPDTNRLARNDNTAMGDPADYPHAVIARKAASKLASETASGYGWEEPLVKTWSEFKSKYPHNKVLETPSGHLFEIDDTIGFERIHIYHKNGGYIEMGGGVGPGNRMDKIAGDWYIGVDRNLYKAVAGDIHASGRHLTHLGKTFSVACKTITLGAPTVNIPGVVSVGSISAKDGCSGTFTSVGGRIITVQGGLITAIGEAS